MPRGGKRPGAGRPRKPVEQHLADGTFRPHRHQHLLARPLVPPRGRKKTVVERYREMYQGEHWRFSHRQVHLARRGPDYVFYGWDISSPEAQASVAEWQAWNERYGFDWRMQNECPNLEDGATLAARLGIAPTPPSAEQFVAAVDEHIVNWDPELPKPPRWDEVSRPPSKPFHPGVEAFLDGALLRVACGHCGAKLILLPHTVAATIPKRNLPRTRRALGDLRDEDGFHYALLDQNLHFPCPHCNQDQLMSLL